MQWMHFDETPYDEDKMPTSGRIWNGSGWVYYQACYDIDHGWSIDNQPYDKEDHPKFQWLSQNKGDV